MRANKDIPSLRFGNKIYPEDLATSQNPWANFFYVDGDNGSDSTNNGTSVDKSTATIQQAVTNAGRNDVVIVRALAMATAATDPSSYTENVVIPATDDLLTIIGAGTGQAQGGLPQLKVGDTTTQALITVRAPGCAIRDMGFNGSGATGGGIVLDDDGGTAKTAFGTTVTGSHFKNCKGTTATNAATGGAIQWAATGGAWQVRIQGNRFYKNVGDVVLLGTTGSVPQDVYIGENEFSGPAANVDCNLYLAGGSGMNGVTINNNVFQQLPAIGSGAVARYIDATGCTGMLTNNTFGCLTADTGTTLTFLAAGTAAKIPTTMHVAGNWGQSNTTTEVASITIGANT